MTPGRGFVMSGVAYLRRVVVASMLVVGASSAFALAPLSPTVFEAAQVNGDSMAAAVVMKPVGQVDWWNGFRDSTLNLLEQMAYERRPTPGTQFGGAQAGDVAASLASAYVQARALRVRLITAQAIALIARRQAERLVQPASAGSRETVAAQRAAAMAERAQHAAADFAATLDQRINEIAALTGMDPAQARTVLEPSLASLQLPAFSAEVPTRLPAQVVRGRADVRLLEASLVHGRTGSIGQYRVAEFAAALGGWIEPGDDKSTDAAPASVVVHAKAEVAAALYRLVQQQKAATMNYQIAQLRRVEFETVLRRQALGEAAEGEVLDKHLLLLAETDRIASVAGAMADSWIALNVATGGLAAIAAAGPDSPGQPAGVAQKP